MMAVRRALSLLLTSCESSIVAAASLMLIAWHVDRGRCDESAVWQQNPIRMAAKSYPARNRPKNTNLLLQGNSRAPLLRKLFLTGCKLPPQYHHALHVAPLPMFPISTFLASKMCERLLQLFHLGCGRGVVGEARINMCACVQCPFQLCFYLQNCATMG